MVFLSLEKEREECKFQLRRKLELKKLEANTVLRMRELELQSISVVGNPCDRSHSASNSTCAFDMSKHISMVPICYIGAFEHALIALHWAKGYVGFSLTV